MKYVAFLGAWLWISAAMAECVGGTWVTVNSVASNPNGNCTAEKCNGATFCRSNGQMNWWSAFTWCASNGLHLVKFEEACPGIPTSTNRVAGACPNLQGVVSGDQWIWTELGSGKYYAFIISLLSGIVEGNTTTAARAYSVYALCK